MENTTPSLNLLCGWILEEEAQVYLEQVWHNLS